MWQCTTEYSASLSVLQIVLIITWLTQEKVWGHLVHSRETPKQLWNGVRMDIRSNLQFFFLRFYFIFIFCCIFINFAGIGQVSVINSDLEAKYRCWWKFSWKIMYILLSCVNTVFFLFFRIFEFCVSDFQIYFWKLRKRNKTEKVFLIFPMTMHLFLWFKVALSIRILI